MGAILGRVALNGKPVQEGTFRQAFDTLRPASCARSDMHVTGDAGYGHHDSGLGRVSPQPVNEGPLTIVADARLYNRDDLARELDVASGEFSDAALILQAYVRWGEACLSRINGDFGFVIHDRERSEVFLARDHIGVRPLYWTLRGGEVLFATLLKGLTGFTDLTWPLSESRIARYLCNPMDVRLESFLDGVEEVGPGCWLKIRSEGEIIRQRWWNPGEIPERTGITLDAALEEFLALTERAVRVRLPEHGRVGSHFSGGIDSTLVTLIAARQMQGMSRNLTGAYAWSPPVETRYPDMGRRDERNLIAEQCHEINVPARYGGASGATFEALIAHPMELEGTADLMDELPIIEQARADGLGVMLSGWGGDEVFSSHGIGHLAWLLRKCRIGSALQLSRKTAGGLRRVKRMAAYLWRAGIVPMLPDLVYRRFNPYTDLYGGGAFPSDAMKQLDQQFEHQEGVRLVPDADAYMRSLLLNGHIGERMATWAAWAAPAGFEYRYPLTDRHLLDFILSLPREIRFGDGTSRFLVRRAFADLLPKGANKNDVANEKLRLDNRLEWWRMLGFDAQQGRFEVACRWLDMSALRKVVTKEPPIDSDAQIKDFARFFVAMRVLGMDRRHRVKSDVISRAN